MCVTNVYVDRYPDGRELSCSQTEFCQYGRPGAPCAKLSTLENPVRKIGFNELTTEYMLSMARQAFPNTPPRSSGGSHHRTGSRASYVSVSSEEGRGHRHSSKRRSGLATLKPTREHRKERIVIVDSPPTPRTPPVHLPQTFTAPSSPATPPYIVDGMSSRERGRPIIVDERPLHRKRAPSTSAVIGERPRRTSPLRQAWDSPSTSHTSIDLRAVREKEEAQARINRDREERIANLEATARLKEKIRQQDEEIRRRPAVPIPPRPILRPVVDQSDRLNDMMSGLRISEAELKIKEDAEIRRRLEVRDRELKRDLELRKREDERRREDDWKREDDAVFDRLRERQLPRRRFSVGPGGRRTRVVYDDGVYRWE